MGGAFIFYLIPYALLSLCGVGAISIGVQGLRGSGIDSGVGWRIAGRTGRIVGAVTLLIGVICLAGVLFLTLWLRKGIAE